MAVVVGTVLAGMAVSVPPSGASAPTEAHGALTPARHAGLLEADVASAAGPVIGATVTVVSEATGRSLTARSGADGALLVRAPSLGAAGRDDRYRFSVTAPDYFASSRLVALRPDAVDRVSLMLAPDRATVVGRVVTAAGRPLSDVTVSAESAATGAETSTRTAPNGSFDLLGPALPSTSADTGLRLTASRRWTAAASSFVTAPPGTTVHTTLVTPSPSNSHSHSNSASPSALGSASPQPASVTAEGELPAISPTPVPSCPNSADVWNNGTENGSWATGGNWSGGVPTSASFVCIPTGVAGGVTLATSATVTGLLLGTGETLTTSGGTLTISGSSTPSALQGSLDVESGATFAISSGADLLNATGATLTLNGTGQVHGTFEQDAGSVAVGAGDNPVQLDNGASLVLAGTGGGSFTVDDPVVASPTVSLSGNIAADQTVTVDAEDLCTGPGTTTLSATGSFSNAGTIAISQGGGCTSGSAVLSVPTDDTLTNSGTLAVAGAPSGSGTQTLEGAFVNTGTIDIGVSGKSGASTVLAAGASLDNQGTLSVLSSAASSNAKTSSLTLDAATTGPSAEPAASLTNDTGGSLVDQGTVAVQGSFTQGAGSVATGSGDNAVQLENDSSLDVTGTGAGSFTVFDPVSASPTVDLSGNIAAGQILTVDAEDLCTGAGTTTLSATGSFSNAGTIAISQGGGCTSGSAVLSVPTDDTLTNSGTLAVAGAPSGSGTQTLEGAFVNTGTIDIGVSGKSGASTVLAAGASLDNQGTLSVLSSAASSNAKTSSLTLDAATTGPSAEPAASLTNDTGGSLVDQGTVAVQGSFTQGAGSVATGSGDNAVQLENDSSLDVTGTGAGSFTVFDPVSASPTVDLSGNIAAGQILTVDAEDLCTGAGTTTLSATGSFSNAGTIAISQGGGCTTGSAVLSVPTDDTLTNSGTLAVAGAPSGSGTQTLEGAFVNTGTIDIGVSGKSGASTVLAAGASLDNQGTLSVLSSAASSNAKTSSLTLDPTTTFTNDAGGSVTNGGLVAEQGSFTQKAGTIATGSGDNAVQLENGSSLDVTGTGAGSFTVFDPVSASPTVDLSGNLVAGQILTVDAEDLCTGAGTTTLDAASSFTNAGTIAISQGGNCTSGSVAIDVSGTLSNSGTLDLEGPPAGSGTQTFTGDLTNTGTVEVGEHETAHASVSAGSAFVNEGAVTVAAVSTLNVDGPAGTFTNGSGGSVTLPGTLYVSDTFVQDAGTVTTGSGDNPVDLRSGATIDFGGTGAGSFVVSDPTVASPSATVSGNTSPGQILTVDGEDLCGGAGTTTVTVPSSFVNAGTFATGHSGGCGGGSVNVSYPSSDTFTNTGTLQLVGPTGGASAGAQTFAGNLANQGIMSVASTAKVTVAGGLTQSAAGTLGYEILAGPPGSVLLAVTGTLALAGTLDFETSSSADISAGQVFHLFTDGSQSGNFSAATGLSAGGDLAYSPSSVSNGVNATVVNLANSPYVTNLAPSSGPAGTIVSVFGSSLTGTTSVTFGGVPAAGVTVVSSTEVNVTAPTGTGSVPVVVTTPQGTTSSLGAPEFTYASVASGSAGSASLTLTVNDSAGAVLSGVVVGLADAATATRSASSPPRQTAPPPNRGSPPARRCSPRWRTTSPPTGRRPGRSPWPLGPTASPSPCRSRRSSPRTRPTSPPGERPRRHGPRCCHWPAPACRAAPWPAPRAWPRFSSRSTTRRANI